MGLDYIRAQTGKPWRKRWKGGLDRLKAPTLIDLTVTEAARTVTAELNAGARVKAGDKLIVQSASGGLTVSDGLRAIGRITEDGLAVFGRGKRVICMDGLDLYEMLDREIPLRQVLERKVRRAAETGSPFIRVRDLFPQ